MSTAIALYNVKKNQLQPLLFPVLVHDATVRAHHDVTVHVHLLRDVIVHYHPLHVHNFTVPGRAILHGVPHVHHRSTSTMVDYSSLDATRKVR